MLAEEADRSGKEGNAVEKLMTRIRQKLCRHMYSDARLKAVYNEENYTFTNVCEKCGKIYTAMIVPRKSIEIWEKENKL